MVSKSSLFFLNFILFLGVSFVMVMFWAVSGFMGEMVVLMSSLVVTFLSIFYLHNQGMSVFSLSDWFLSDSMSSLMCLMSCFVIVLSFLCSDVEFNMMKKDPGFSFFLLLILFISLVFFYSSSVFSFYFLMEASLIPILFLILSWGYQPERVQAGFLIIMYTVVASMPFLVSISFLLNIMGSDNFNCLLASRGVGVSIELMFWFFIILGFLVKLPVFMLHSWLPKAHVKAPVGGSMILAGIMLKFGGFGLWRFLPVLGRADSEVLEFTMVFTMWGGLVCSMICLCHYDMKAMIAFSSISHMSAVVLGMLTFYCMGWMGGVAMMFIHGVCSPCLFAMANYSYKFSGSRSIFLCKGLLKVCPLISLFWFMFCSFNLGCPPSLNFFSEVFLSLSGLWYSWYFICILIFMVFLGGASSVYLYCTLNHGAHSYVLLSKSGVSDRMSLMGVSCCFFLFFSFFVMDFVFCL
uniref:NADH-ubiquinone oxidoreductase chain 4 n=1 Tax=Sinonovacula constricta TaxID=98310 RepID=B5AYF3_SINCO|nr:NADH dehydrogenase subunit 4 [Sinonovacula constricta]ACF41620.1 NADH dehydrogenase subunit 4 [Sinonovacula constricta]